MFEESWDLENKENTEYKLQENFVSISKFINSKNIGTIHTDIPSRPGKTGDLYLYSNSGVHRIYLYIVGIGWVYSSLTL